MARKAAAAAAPKAKAKAPKARAKPQAVAAAAMDVEHVSLSLLHEDPANARKHPERNLEVIRASLKENGQVKPLLVQKSSGRVIDGNGTLAAMKLLGWNHAHVHWLDIDDAKATRLGITMNRSAELAEWDMPILQRLLEESARDDDTNYDALGYTPDEIAKLADQAVVAAASAEQEASDAMARSDDGELAEETEDAPAPVCTVQLFFDLDTQEQFLAMVDRASAELGTTNLTDTVLAVMSAGYAED